MMRRIRFGILLGLSAVFAVAAGADENGLKNLQLVEGDERGNEVKALKTELMVRKTEKLAISQIQKLIKKHKGTRLEPELWFRLAELHMRKAKSERFFEIHRKSETVVSLAPQVVKKASSRRSIKTAVNVYDQIQRKFPNFHQLDLVIFNNAFARQSIGENLIAEKLYWQLIKKFENSPLVPDSHLAIGEINFDRGKFKFALSHFNAIKKYKNSRVYPYGLYKAGWTYYNMHEPKSAIKELEKVVEYGRYVRANQIDARLDLSKEALDDITIFYEDVYPASNAYAYFSKQAGDALDVTPVLLKLSRIYERHSRYKDRETILKDIIQRLPASHLQVKANNDLILNYESMKDREKAVSQMKTFYDLCDPEGAWALAQAEKREQKIDPKEIGSVDECKSTLNDTTLRLAGKWLRTWKKNKSFIEFADASEQAFEIYLRNNTSRSKELSEARFAYAELLFQREKFRKASTQYAKVGGVGATTKLSHDASYAALLSLEKAVKDKWNDQDEKSFHEMAKKYVDEHPKGKYRVDIEFKMGLIAYEKGRYDEAGPIFMALGDKFPKTEKGQKSQDLYLDILNIKKDYKGLTEYSDKLMVKGGSPDRLAKLKKIYEESYFLQVQQLEEKGEYQKAIAQYKSFAKKNPSSALSEKAWWNAVQLHFKALDYLGGAVASVQFSRRFPNSIHNVDALLKAAQTFENMGQLRDAADVLMKLVVLDQKSAVKWKALAADFYSLSRIYSKAIDLYTELERSSDADVAYRALEQKELLYKHLGDQSKHAEILQKMARTGRQPVASLAQLNVVEQLYETKKFEDAFIQAKKVLNMGSEASNHAKAKARYIQAMILKDEFVRQSVKSQLSRFTMVIALKTEKLEKAQTAFQAAMRFGDAQVTAMALEQLADCYGHYTMALKTMPIPEGLPSTEEPAFRNELQSLIIPMEEKSVETMAQALASAQKFELRDGTIPELKKKVDELNMKAVQGLVWEVEAPGLALPEPAGV